MRRREYDSKGQLLTRDQRAHTNVERDHAFWQKLASAFGWQLYGFDEQATATFRTDANWETIFVTAHQRQQLLAALRRAKVKA
jgi:hypothetical protein